MLAGHASATICDRSVACPRWDERFGPRRANRRDRLLLGSHRDEGDDELTSKPDFHSLSAPYLGETAPMGSRGTPFYDWRGTELRK